MSVSTVTTNGLRIVYSDTGTGHPVVFVHGFPLNRTMWHPQVQALSSTYRIVTVDLRGHGESDAPLWRYRVEDFAGDILTVLDDLRLPRAILVGLSMGGYVALAFARLFPGRLNSLVLTDTRAQADSPEGRQGRFQLAQAAYERGAGAVADAMLPKLLSPKTRDTRPELVADVRHMIESMRLGGIVGDLMAMADRPDSLPLLGAIGCPTLVVVGADDQTTPVSDARLMAERIPGARLEIIPEAGHLPNLEQPSAFNACLDRFLRELS
ncbi:alpha/beta hydrolase [Nitrospira sp.]|nr:alpha/beta hydrolase [Nitrospira sp.]